MEAKTYRAIGYRYGDKKERCLLPGRPQKGFLFTSAVGSADECRLAIFLAVDRMVVLELRVAHLVFASSTASAPVLT